MKTEEVLFKVRDFGWPSERYWSATLLTYDDGSQNFHMQTHEFHDASVKLANEILKNRKLKIGQAKFLGPSGLYYSIEKL